MIKIFTADTDSELEQAINQFIRKHNAKVTQIQYQVTDKDVLGYSAMILYHYA